MTRSQRIALAMRGFPRPIHTAVAPFPVLLRHVYGELRTSWNDAAFEYDGFLTIPMRDGLLAVKPPRGTPCS